MAIERDFRKLAPAVQSELRRVAVGMVAAGKTRIEAAAAVGVNRRFVGEWVKAAAQFGEAALARRRRGRRPGEQRALTAAQEDKLRALIATQCPDQVQLPFALWTRAAVRMLIARATGVTLALPVVGRSLRRWGFTPQRPIRRATERRDPEVRAWLETAYPAIAERATAEGGEIQWADETGVSNQANYGRSFAPQGETPIIPRPATRFFLSMIASLTNRGKLRFMIHEGALNAAIFLVFLRRLIRDAPCKVFLIVDNLKPHRARVVKDWLKDHSDRIELFYLPAYAPEHDPEEFLNNDLKQTLARRSTPKTKAAFKSGLTSYMRSLQRQPAKVRAFFQAPSVHYAA
jgi:transposase